MQITFLGTSSGGGPSPSRNCSSLGLSNHPSFLLVISLIIGKFQSQASSETEYCGVRDVRMLLRIL